jgi:hypothetical protein
MLQHRHPQPGVLDGEPDPGLHRGFGQAIGTPHHLREPPAAPRTEVPVPEADDLGGSEVEPVRQRVDGHHRVEQPRAAGQVVGGAQRRRHRDAVHGGDLVGREQVGAHHETRPGALPAGPQDAPSNSAADQPPSTPRPCTTSAAARDRSPRVSSTSDRT